MRKTTISPDRLEISKEFLRLNDTTIEYNKIKSYRVHGDASILSSGLLAFFPMPSIELIMKDAKIIYIYRPSFYIYRSVSNQNFSFDTSEASMSNEMEFIRSIENAVFKNGVPSVLFTGLEVKMFAGCLVFNILLQIIFRNNHTISAYCAFGIPLVFLLGFILLFTVIRQTVIVR